MLGEAKAALRLAAACRWAGAAGAALLFAISAAHAGDDTAPGWRELWVGADASSHTWLIYGGATIAPFSDIFSDGVRLRAASGYGGYHYTGLRHSHTTTYDASTAFADALVGYLKRLGPLTAKAFVGASAIEHDVTPLDPENPVQGRAYGPKAVVELWLNMGAKAWSSLDVNWTSAHETYAGRLRTGYRIFDDVTLGAEARVDGNALDKDARGGLFLRYAWHGGEVSLAGGVAGRFFEDARDMTDPYATANWLVQY
jgi:Cellulose biosynthesis protein BcsS